jgi:hypothetical protein
MLHQNRIEVKIDDTIVYCDNFKGNQDPYVWSERFLNTFCKTTQIKASQLKKGDTLFWFSRQGNPSEDRWFVDLVFIVDEISYWEKSDKAGEAVDYPFEHYNDVKLSTIKYDEYSYKDHYEWAKNDHPKTSSRPKRRFTIVASKESYQPQTEHKELIEIKDKYILDMFEQSPRGGSGFRCKEINDKEVKYIESYILENKKIELKGSDLFKLRRDSKKWESMKWRCERWKKKRWKSKKH